MDIRNREIRAVLDELLETTSLESFSNPKQLILDLELEKSWTPIVLIIGNKLPILDSKMLMNHGCTIETVQSFEKGLLLMFRRKFDFIIVVPSLDEEGDGVRFVRSFKKDVTEDIEKPTQIFKKKYNRTPFLILPLPTTDEYALYIDSENWFLANRKEIPIWKTVLGLGEYQSGNNSDNVA